MLAVDLQMKAQPEQKEALIARAVHEWKNADADSLAVLATWLNGHGEFERTLREIPLEKSLGARALFLQHVDALGALGRWAEIKRLLESERFPLEPFMQKMYLARCNAQLGEETAAQNNWQRALESAAGDLQKLMPLADYAEKNGATEIAAAAYDSAATAAPALRLAQQGRLRLAQAARDTHRLHAILAEMLAASGLTTPRCRTTKPTSARSSSRREARPCRERATKRPAHPSPPCRPPIRRRSSTATPMPSASLDPKAAPAAPIPSPAVASDLVMLEEIAQALIEKEPASLPHRTLLALVRLKRGQAAGALEVYSGINVAPRALTPSALAMHAAVLAANGQTEAARAEMRKSRPNNCSPKKKRCCPIYSRIAARRRTQHQISTQHSALSTQHSALSTQHSALSTQHSALSTQHSALSTQQFPSPLVLKPQMLHRQPVIDQLAQRIDPDPQMQIQELRA